MRVRMFALQIDAKKKEKNVERVFTFFSSSSSTLHFFFFRKKIGTIEEAEREQNVVRLLKRFLYHYSDAQPKNCLQAIFTFHQLTKRKRRVSYCSFIHLKKSFGQSVSHPFFVRRRRQIFFAQ